jgi:hypothetical protein
VCSSDLTLAPFQLAIIASKENTKRLLSVFAISLPGSNNRSISIKQLFMRLYEKEKNITNKKNFHHCLEGVGGFNLFTIMLILKIWVIKTPNITLIKMR